MRKERTSFEKSVMKAKLSDGPTAPKPGPILPRHVITEVRHVVKSAFPKDTRKVPTKRRKMYRNMWLAISETESEERALPLTLGVLMALG